MQPVSDEDRSERRFFDDAAETYDRARQEYPPELFGALVELSGVPEGGRILEIGPGTGKATRPMAERGYAITAVELGASLASVARRNLALFPNVEILVAGFEDWPLTKEPFDLVMAATAWHWLDQKPAIQKAARALRPGGALAIFGYTHVAGGTEQFFIDAQECYERWDPRTPVGIRLTPSADIELHTTDIDESGLFEACHHRRFEWLRTYTTRLYMDVLHTYAGNLAMEADARNGLFSCIAQLLDERYGGKIEKAYLCDLIVARRL
jgi:SAM-dependent methyltransferase